MKDEVMMIEPTRGFIAPKVDDLLEVFLSGRKQTTIRAYKQDLQSFTRFVECNSVYDAMSEFLTLTQGQANFTAMTYKNYLIDKGLASNTINRKLSALKSIIKMARMLGLINYSLDVQAVKTKAYRDTSGNTIAEVSRLIKVATVQRNEGKASRDVAMLRLLFDLALRREEVVSLDYESLDLEKGKIKILGKGRTQTELLSIAVATIEALRDWIEVRGNHEGALFIAMDRASGDGVRISGRSLHRLVKSLAQKAGFKSHPHSLRHTAITQCVIEAKNNGIGLEECLQFSRHADVRTMMIYYQNHRDVQGQLSSLISQVV
jgi:integrase/recombinase XerC